MKEDEMEWHTESKQEMRNAYKVFNEKYQGKDNFGKMCVGWTILKRQSSGSHGGEYEDNSLLGCKPCSLVEVDRRFRGAYFLHHPDVIPNIKRFLENSV
jgi:hypothetical protein